MNTGLMPWSYFSAQARALRTARSEARARHHALYRFRRHACDRLPADVVAEGRGLELALEAAVDSDSVESMRAGSAQAEAFLERHQPPTTWDGVRENVEVLVVAVVIALAVRAYFVQPFKIPTGSMEPTLMGVAARTFTGPKPGLVRRAAELVLLGRRYHELRVTEGGRLEAMQPGRVFTWWEYTDLQIGAHVYRVWMNADVLQQKLGVVPGTVYRAGDTVVHAVTEAGDQILVNKIAYHFRGPARGEVFVFKTNNIEMLEERLRDEGVEGSQYYIKRCVAIGGDVVTIEPPLLYINGARARGLGFDRVQSRQDGYGGYRLADSMQAQLRVVGDVLQLPPDTALALGDNSGASFDSRYWGPVPRVNAVGTAFFVYWPFSARWGVVR